MLNKEDLKALGLTDEQVEKVQQGYSDAIPRTRLNELNAEISQLKETKQTLEAKIQATDKLNEIIAAKDIEIAKLKTDHQNELKAVEIKRLFNEALQKEGAINQKALEPFFDLTKLQTDEKGENIVGLAEQIKALKEDKHTSFLFATRKQVDFGYKPNTGDNGNLTDPVDLTSAITQYYTE